MIVMDSETLLKVVAKHQTLKNHHQTPFCTNIRVINLAQNFIVSEIFLTSIVIKEIVNFLFSAIFHFTLHGSSGNEAVTIMDDEGTKNATLTTTAESFSTFSRTITVKFQNDGYGMEVLFGSFEDVGIRSKTKWEEWKCDDLNDERDGDANCNKVRGGKFAWRGNYEIKFVGKKLVFLNI